MSQEALDRLTEQFAEAVYDTHAEHGDETAVIRPDKVVEICRFLKDDAELDFKLLTSVTGVDRLLLPESSPRFEVIYHLYSITKQHRLRLKARIDEPEPGKNPEIDSVAGVWRTADWWERHVWDMYGVKFRGHPNLKRLYLYEEFVGHPLRKDYPLKGRQPLIAERDFRDLVRGPGANRA